MQFRINPIIPRPLNVSGIQQALIDGMRDVGQRIREDFEETIKTWKHKPKFDPAFPIPKVSFDSISVMTETDDQRYRWTNDGTKRHFIPFPGGKTLVFPSEFIPKTFPGIIGSGVGFSGGNTMFSAGLMHPGTEPRDFSGHIGDKNLGNFKLTMDRAMKLAARSSGHSFR